MSWEALERRFRAVGVPLRRAERPWFGIDVDRRPTGERIELAPGDASVQVMDSDPAHRQLLLLVKDTNGWGKPTTQKVLCGRDERSLFAVTVPNRLGVAVNTVAAAHEALKPEQVRDAERDDPWQGGYRRRCCKRARARSRGVLRQGDWFFVPYPDAWLRCTSVRKRARLGFGNPHIVDQLVGDVNQFYNGFGWSRSGVTPVFARGFVRHREHRPLNLRCWHRVFPNTAIRAPGGYAD